MPTPSSNLSTAGQFATVIPMNESLEENVTLANQLQQMIDNYLGQHPHMSLNALALKSGVGATTLRRIKKNSIKGGPAPHTVLALTSAITNEKRLSILVERFEGPLGDLLKQSFGPYIEKSVQHTYQVDLNNHLKDTTSYFVFKHCANRSGCTRKIIEKNYGLLGLQKLDMLIEYNVVEERGTKLHAIENDFTLNLDIALAHLPYLTTHFKTEKIGEGKNLFYSLSESLNEEGIQKIKSAKKDAIKKIIDIMKSPFYEGDIPYFSITMCDTLEMSEAIQ